MATNTDYEAPESTTPSAATSPPSTTTTPTATPKPKGKGKGKRPRLPPPDHTPADVAEQPRPARMPTPYDNCPACKGNQSKFDERHTRIAGECT